MTFQLILLQQQAKKKKTKYSENFQGRTFQVKLLQMALIL